MQLLDFDIEVHAALGKRRQIALNHTSDTRQRWVIHHAVDQGHCLISLRKISVNGSGTICRVLARDFAACDSPRCLSTCCNVGRVGSGLSSVSRLPCATGCHELLELGRPLDQASIDGLHLQGAIGCWVAAAVDDEGLIFRRSGNKASLFRAPLQFLHPGGHICPASHIPRKHKSLIFRRSRLQAVLRRRRRAGVVVAHLRRGQLRKLRLIHRVSHLLLLFPHGVFARKLLPHQGIDHAAILLRHPRVLLQRQERGDIHPASTTTTISAARAAGGHGDSTALGHIGAQVDSSFL